MLRIMGAGGGGEAAEDNTEKTGWRLQRKVRGASQPAGASCRGEEGGAHARPRAPPSIRMHSASCSVSHPPGSVSFPTHHPPSTHLTPPASKCSHRLILRLWLHTGRPRILFLRQLAPDSAPSSSSPVSPPLPSSPPPLPFPARTTWLSGTLLQPPLYCY